MANLRTFYACQAVAVAAREPDSSTGLYTSRTRDYQYMHGIQSVGINSTFETDNVFELGQIDIYDSVLNVPQVEITIEKALDGYTTPFGYICNSTTNSEKTLAKTSKHRADVKFGLYADSGNAGSAPPIVTMECTGMYVTNVTYTFPVDGNCTESVTLVGNYKAFSTSANSGITIPNDVSNPNANPNDKPNWTADNRMIRRQDIVYTGPGSNKAQTVTVTLNLNREDVFEFGKRIPYAKIATFPIEVTTEVQSLLVDDNTDTSAFTEATVVNPDKDQTISVSGGVLKIDLGSKNFLASVNQTGGDAGGGNATITRSYTTYNFMTVIDDGATGNS